MRRLSCSIRRTLPVARAAWFVAVTVTTALSALACGSDAAASAGVVVDTLPGGIVRTMSSTPVEAGRWHLVLEREVQPPEDAEGELLNPIDMAISDDGHVLTFEESPKQIRVYDSEGNFVRAIGRNGKGPGEFAAGMLAVRGDTAAVQDPMNQRLSTWNWRTGALLAEQRSVCCVWSSLGIDGTGKVWVPRSTSYSDSSYAFNRAYVRIPLSGDGVDSIFALERQSLPRAPRWELRQDGYRSTMGVPLHPLVVFETDPTAGLITGYTGEYSLRASTNGIDTTAIFGRTFTQVPVTAAEKAALVDERVRQHLSGASPWRWDEATLRRAFDASLIPNHRPAWARLSVDRAGRRWVWLSTKDTTHISFDLFGPDGRWLDTVQSPGESWPMKGYPRVAWGRDLVAVSAEDEEGRPLVRVFRIERR